ncbi:MAG: hypothetical protein O3C40_09220 [Planctomycetota bacterium]|nr:hypothetical protein [Planctomycetota bacterium]
MSHQESTTSRLSSVGEVRATSDAPVDRSSNNQNRRAVKFLREGNLVEALCILRSLVLKPGCTWMRPEVSNLVKRNFATALLLDGHPSGCLEILAEIKDETHPRVRELRAAIERWEKTLSFFQWLNWWTGRIEPTNRPVLIEFILGELEAESPRVESAQAGSQGSNLSTAV